MNILHCCLSCFYNENYNYQENLLSRQNKKDGHEVMIIASTEVFRDNKNYDYIEPETYVNDYGIKVIRVPYKRIINKSLSRKIRSYKGVYPILEEFEPDLILFHGIGAWELLTIRTYIKRHPQVKLYVDSHASYFNSGKNWISIIFLHKMIYRFALKRTIPFIEKILYIGLDEHKFAKEVYGLPEEVLEIYPLGGKIESTDKYLERRKKIRDKLNISDNIILFFHSGKMDKGKKTCEMLNAFGKNSNSEFRLIIAGSFFPDVEAEAEALIAKDPRVEFVGWKSSEGITDLLSAADVYLQPGTQSATLQNAMCARCAIVTKPFDTYKYILESEAWYITDETNLLYIFEEICLHPELVSAKGEGAFLQAKKKLDYRELAKRFY